MADVSLTARELGALIGVDERTVRKLADKSAVIRCARGRYARDESVQAYCAHLRFAASGRGDEETALDLPRERARLAKEQADAQEIKNAALRNDLLPAREVEARWSAILRDVRANALALPARVGQRLAHLSPSDLAIVDREVRDMLTEMADA